MTHNGMPAPPGDVSHAAQAQNNVPLQKSAKSSVVYEIWKMEFVSLFKDKPSLFFQLQVAIHFF